MLIEGITGSIVVNQCSPDLLLSCLGKMQQIRREKILTLQDRMKKYELKRAQEQAAYHKMSALKKLFSGKPPVNHLAVEHMVYIKQPMHEIDKLNAEISYLHELAAKIKEGPDSLSIRPPFTQELEQLYLKGWAINE